jgi:hypothetical protein
LRWTFRIAAVFVLVCVLAFAVLARTQLYHHFFLFPKQAAAWKDLEAKRVPVPLKTGWNEYRGIIHCHSKISHDSLMEFPDILDAMHQAKCQFNLMTDHVVDGKADFSLGWNGIHDGVLFVHGYEMNQGVMPWGLPANTILDANEPPEKLAKQIHALGGVLFYAHCEEKRTWDVPELDGVEIYNIHSDLLLNIRSKKTIGNLFLDVLLNQRSYPDETVRTLFHRPVLDRLLAQWDVQSANRKLTGIAGNDCHNNCGVRGIYTDHDTLFVIDTGHNEPDHKVAELKLNAFTRTALRLMFGPLEPNKQVFRFDLDPYQRMSRFVNTYLLANELTEPDLLDALRAGRAYVAFSMIADPSGFAYIAEGNGKKATLGESIPLSPDLTLRAATPLPCRFILVHNGKKIEQKEGATFEFTPKEPGKYRIEAELNIVGEWTPWIYANPIEVTPAAAP